MFINNNKEIGKKRKIDEISGGLENKGNDPKKQKIKDNDINIIEEIEKQKLSIDIPELKNRIMSYANNLNKIKSKMIGTKQKYEFERQISLINKLKTGEIKLLLVRNLDDINDKIKLEPDLEFVQILLNASLKVDVQQGLKGNYVQSITLDKIDFFKSLEKDIDFDCYENIGNEEFKKLAEEKTITKDGLPKLLLDGMIKHLKHFETLFGFEDLDIKEECLDLIYNDDWKLTNDDKEFIGNWIFRCYMLRKKN